jgi:hypothetical protein
MLEFMAMGGALMWPILMIGVLSIAFAVRDVLLGSEPGSTTRRLALSSLTMSVGWSLCGIVMTCTHAQGNDAILIQGVGESCCPAALGLLLFAAGQLALAITPARRLRA